jgi:hypothetical protein
MTPATREALDQLARELHNRAGQDLTAAILDLEFFRGQVIHEEDLSQLLAALRRTLEQVREATQTLRQLAK